MRPSVAEDRECGPVSTMVRVNDLRAKWGLERHRFAQPAKVIKSAGQNYGYRRFHEVIMGEQEGVIKFELTHVDEALSEDVCGALGALLGWRRVMFELGMVGQDLRCYEGAGFGNVSVRLDVAGAFLVSGTQTSGLRAPTSTDFALVERADAESNRVWSRGKTRPSSESITHAVLYKMNPDIRCVLHAHDRVIWDCASDLGLATTPADIEYGTPDMAAAVQEIVRRIGDAGVFSMGGHRDGIIAFGRNEDEAGKRLVAARARAHELEYRCQM